jgi:hypothetical protein
MRRFDFLLPAAPFWWMALRVLGFTFDRSFRQDIFTMPAAPVRLTSY